MDKFYEEPEELLEGGDTGIITIGGKEVDTSSFSVDNIIIIIDYINDNIIKYKKNFDTIVSKKNKKMSCFCDDIKKSNGEIKKVISHVSDEASSQFKELLNNIYISAYTIIENQENDFINETDLTRLHSILINIDKIILVMNKKTKTISIIGSNGVGKSTFIGFLKRLYDDNMVIIPAQKILGFTIDGDNYTKTEEDYQEFIDTNYIDEYQSNYFNYGHVTRAFSTAISVVVTKVLDEYNNFYENKSEFKNLNQFETFLDKINNIWKKIIPHIFFRINTKEHCLNPVDNYGNEYNINSMSDGEKVILFHIINVLLAKNLYYIVVDEPETYLNPSLYQLLWDELENARPDCKFIYITHDVEFVKTRDNNTLLWMKKFTYPNLWEIEDVKKEIDIPRNIWIEICGRRKNILFCEGEKESLDYCIYNKLFGDKYNVIPVEGCMEVEKYTKIINKMDKYFNFCAMGIVDNDGRTDQEIKLLKNENIYVTKFNEIEMLLCDDIILDYTLQLFDCDLKKQKIRTFKNAFYKLVKDKQDIIISNSIKKNVDVCLNNYKINSQKIDDIKNEINNIIDFDKLKRLEKKLKNKIDDIINNKKYDDMLGMCNLKNEITKGLANKMVTNFENQAKNAIVNNKDYILKKYFFDFDE